MPKPKLSPRQEELLAQLYKTGNHSMNDLARTYDVSRRTVGRALWRKGLTGAIHATGISDLEREILAIVNRYHKDRLLWSTSMNDELIALMNTRSARAA